VLSNSSIRRDGYGAQIQRILSIKALANELGLRFQLNPIVSADDQVTQVPLPVRERECEILEINQYLAKICNEGLYSITELGDSSTAADTRALFRILIFNLCRRTGSSPSILIKMEDAYSFTQRNPDLYNNLDIGCSTNCEDPSRKREVTIHVHLRYANFALGTERYLDPEYYFKSLTSIVDSLELEGKKYRIILHSDFSDPEIIHQENQHQITQETSDYLYHLNLVENDFTPNRIYLDTAVSLTKEISAKFSNVEQRYNESTFEALIEMSSADYLVLSKSSFAFVAGVLNKNGKVFSPIYWNRIPRAWNSF